MCRVTVQRAADDGIMFDKHDTLAGRHRRIRRCEPGRAAADDQHVANGGAVLVMVGIGLGGRGAKPGGAADEMFIKQPKFRPAKEGLVVETRRQEGCGEADRGTEIEPQSRPTVLAAGDQSRGDEQVGGARVGFGAAVGSGSDQCVGLLDAGPQHAARAMVFEAAAEHHDAAGH